MVKTMKILMVNDIASVGYNLSVELRRRGHDVTLTAKKKYGMDYPPWVYVYKNKIDEFLTGRKNKDEFDIVHDHYLLNFASLGTITKMRKNKKLLLHVHGSDTRPRFGVKKLQNYLIHSSNTVLYSTPDLYNNIPDDINRKFMPSPVEIPDTEKYKSIEKNNRILIFATLNRVKKIEQLFPVIKETDYGYDMIYIGPDRDYYRRIAPDNVKFVKPVERNKLNEFLSSYSLVIGRQEGTLGVSELESMALGVTTLFPFGYPGHYDVPPPTFDATVENIETHFGDTNLGEKQREWVKEHHSVERVVDSLIGTYENIIE